VTLGHRGNFAEAVWQFAGVSDKSARTKRWIGIKRRMRLIVSALETQAERMVCG
jgi:hypothetical protein